MSYPALKNDGSNSLQETSAGFSELARGLYARAREDDSTGADIIDINDLLAIHNTGKKYPLWNLRVNDAPLSAWVRLEHGHWLAELEWLNVYGEGASPQEAISELEIHIDHFRKSYANETSDQLTEYAYELKIRYSHINSCE
jgi:hypothetical protein